MSEAAQGPDGHYDAVVVGSGFGGAVVAHALATHGEDPWKVCLLERGKRYAPGDFPRTPHEFKRSFWDPSAGLFGMYDVWSFSGLAAVAASGLGGGSLIYANVLERPPEGWMTVDDPVSGIQSRWPLEPGALDPHFAAVLEMIPTARYPLAESTPKTQAFKRAAQAAGLEVTHPQLAVQFGGDGADGARSSFGDPKDNMHGRQRLTCDSVGECDIGCNLGAKHSLDMTYLSALQRAENAEVWPLREVKSFWPAKDGRGFEVEVLTHAPDAEPPHRPARTVVSCGKLVLAAGTLGTSLLMLRNRLGLPGMSRRVGRRFCGNGDYLAFAADCNSGSNGRPEPIEASKGPVITTSARGRDASDGGDGPGFHLQDGGYPAWAGWLGQFSGVKRDLKRVEWQARRLVQGSMRGDPEDNLSAELAGVLSESGSQLLPILSLGRDDPSGRLRLRGRRLEVDWRKDESGALFERTEAATRRMADALGARHVDPLRLLRPITVHPLGGCSMGPTAATGVVDSYGAVHGIKDLVIADGSVLPGPVGINPALTIAAIADRAAKRLIEAGRPG